MQIEAKLIFPQGGEGDTGTVYWIGWNLSLPTTSRSVKKVDGSKARIPQPGRVCCTRTVHSFLLKNTFFSAEGRPRIGALHSLYNLMIGIVTRCACEVLSECIGEITCR